MTEVPQRGDGFDSGGSPVQSADERGLAGTRGLDLKHLDLKHLDLKQLLPLVASDEKATRILKDAIAGTGGGAGAIGGRELNELLGQILPEEWASGVGGFIGGFGAGLLNKKIKKPISRRRR